MKTVLVVEDDPHQRLLYEWELGDDGYRVVTAAGIDDAAQKVAEGLPDCIVLDVNWRDRDDPTRVQSFLRGNRDIPLVVNTCSNDCGGEMLRSLADDCVIKSSDVEELKQHVRSVLEGRFGTSGLNRSGGVGHESSHAGLGSQDIARFRRVQAAARGG